MPSGSAPTSPRRTGRPSGTASPCPYGCPRTPRGRCASDTSSGTWAAGPSPRTTARTRSCATTELRLDPGAVLALFTDGLVEKSGTDIDEGIERLRSTLDEVGHMPLAETADRVIGEAQQDEDRPDDIALLMAARRDPSR
ncbi:SpoIIE family protein phosphatase [Streptomyces sp. NPDC102441]|uniref:SpoIIE family protein phosphatase n=1 Tax=Streptomyces sp. NPDC102441 TaxID=3366176 RepID=UPI00381E7B65